MNGATNEWLVASTIMHSLQLFDCAYVTAHIQVKIEMLSNYPKSNKIDLKFNMTERVVQLSIGTEEYFSITGIENLINRDKSLFLNTQTFLRLK